MKESVLIITYYWPPSGGAAVQRWLSLANEMAALKTEVYVLTVHEKYATYQLYDESLQSTVNPLIKVFKTKTIEPFGIYKLLFGRKSIPKPAFSDENNPSLVKKIARFIRGNMFIPDPRKGWKYYAVKKGIELINQYHIKNVITAGPPHSTHFIGKSLKSKTGVFWIADFHDLWTDVIYYDLLYHLPAVKRADARLERQILESADFVITVGEKYKEKLLGKSPALTPGKFVILRIGYDETLFESLSSETKTGEFVITYTGTIASYYQPSVLFRALKKMRTIFTDVPLKLRFVGILSKEIKQEIIDYGLQDILEETGYVNHHKAVEYLMQSTMLLLVNPQIREEDMIIPGKIYEYLAARKPIINITKRTAETALIVEQARAGQTFERDMDKGLEDYLRENIKLWKTGQLIKNVSPISQYSRRKIAGQLVNILVPHT